MQRSGWWANGGSGLSPTEPWMSKRDSASARPATTSRPGSRCSRGSSNGSPSGSGRTSRIWRSRSSPTSPAELGRALGAAVRDSTRRHRALTLSRYALLVESANNPVLREQMAVTGARVNAWMSTWLRAIGSPDPDRHVHVIGNYVVGLVLHQLAMPDPDFDPTDTHRGAAGEPAHRGPAACRRTTTIRR